MTAKHKNSSNAPGFPATLGGFITPPAVWVFYFVFIYSFHGVACTDALAGEIGGLRLVPAAVLLASAAALAVHITVGFWSWRLWRKIKTEMNPTEDAEPTGQAHFLAYAAALNAALFALATVWIGAPAFMLQPCQ